MPAEKKKEKRVTPVQRIAVERMWRLFELAQKEWEKNPAHARRYIQLIQGFSTRFRIAIPSKIKNSYCKTCRNVWVEGENVKRRIKGNTLNSNCLICNTLTRRKIIEEKK
jgi:ribonuclease P protein subunit RPR2